MSYLTRRDLLKLSGVAVGSLALGSAISGCGSDNSGIALPAGDPSQRNTLFSSLPPYYPGTETLGPDEMRITFLGTSCIPRLSQECNSIYVEVGSGDQFVFDCGTGVVAKYNAMGIPMSKMNKIFLTHLHGDHTSDLSHIYCFGQAEDRKSPLFIWGPANSGLTWTSPDGKSTRGPFDDGITTFCSHFRELHRWHTESFSFGSTSYAGYDPNTPLSWGLPVAPVPVGGDSLSDAYALVPIELQWPNNGLTAGSPNVAYNNSATGVKITHFPAIHTRRGSISYKLEWNGLSLIFSGDTKPNKNMLQQANGVDILIHEMVVPAEVWAMKNLGITNPDQVDPTIWNNAYNYALSVQNSSHTPQGAFGYILSQIKPPPRLAIATHFQAEDDTIVSATRSVRSHYPVGDFTFASDLMVFNVTKTQIRQRRAVVSDYAFYPPSTPRNDLNLPPYWNYQVPTDPTTPKVGDPYAQIDMTDAVPQNENGKDNWNSNGY